MQAFLRHFPEKREAWTGVKEKMQRPSAPSSVSGVKEEPRSSQKASSTCRLRGPETCSPSQ